MVQALVPGLDVALCVDTPRAVVLVPRDTAARWGPAGELWQHALNTTVTSLVGLVGLAGRTHEAAPGFAVRLIAGDSDCVSAMLLAVPALLDPDGAPHGALISAPTHHAVLVHEVTGRSSVEAIPGFAELTRELHDAGPGALSPAVFWWAAGQLHPVELDLQQYPPTLRLPGALMALSRSLI